MLASLNAFFVRVFSTYREGSLGAALFWAVLSPCVCADISCSRCCGRAILCSRCCDRGASCSRCRICALPGRCEDLAMGTWRCTRGLGTLRSMFSSEPSAVAVGFWAGCALEGPAVCGGTGIGAFLVGSAVWPGCRVRVGAGCCLGGSAGGMFIPTGLLPPISRWSDFKFLNLGISGVSCAVTSRTSRDRAKLSIPSSVMLLPTKNPIFMGHYPIR